MCDKCKDLAKTRWIEHPEDLRAAISVANGKVADGTIEDVTRDPVDVPFADLANGAQWNDIVLFQFRCRQCGQKFELSAETYHGQGGHWKAIAQTRDR